MSFTLLPAIPPAVEQLVVVSTGFCLRYHAQRGYLATFDFKCKLPWQRQLSLVTSSFNMDINFSLWPDADM
jgi:hypothetical protein